ncbi:MAG: recombinase family protein [Patescibacteria group bacterium]
MKKAFAYIRVSTVGQAEEGFSLDNQEGAIKEFCKSRGIFLSRIFNDEGKSGRTINRPEFQEMLNGIRETSVDSVIIYKIDRFARNVADFSRIYDEFKAKGVRLISVLEGDLTGSSSLIPNIFASVAQWESEVNGQRTRDALIQKFKEGWQPTPPPIGYMSIGEKKEKKTCEPDSKIASIIKELFQLYSTGNYSIFELTQWLSEQNIFSRHGTILGHSVVGNILNNPFYYGLIRWHGESKMGNHKPIISKGLFQTCQYVLAKHRDFLTRKRIHNFLLRGFLYCAECGQKYTAEWHKDEKKFKKRGGKIAYYHCQKLDRNKCPSPYVEVTTLEKKVEERIKKLQFSNEFINAVVKKAKETLVESRKNIESLKQGVVNRKSVLLGRRNILEDALLDGTVDRDVFKRKHNDILMKIDLLDEKIEKLDNDCRLDMNLIEEVLAFTRNIYKTYLDAPDFLKRHYLRFFYEKIIIKNKEIYETKPTPVFQALLETNQVIIREDWLPRLDSDQ